VSWQAFLAILPGLPWTLAVTACAFAIGALLGLPLMFARQSKSLVVQLLAGGYVNLVRGIPPIVWLFIIFFGVEIGRFRFNPFEAAIVGLGLTSSAYMAEIYRGGILSIGRGQHEAVSALGLGRVHGFLDVVAPQALRVVVPSLASFAIGLMKDSAVASTIGVAELTERANQQSQVSFTALPVFGITAAFYIAASLPIAYLSRRVDARLRAVVSR